MFEPRSPGNTVSFLLKLTRLAAAAAGSPSATAADLTLDSVSISDVVVGQTTNAVGMTFELLASHAQALVLPQYAYALWRDVSYLCLE